MRLAVISEDKSSSQQRLFPTDIDERPEIEEEETVDVKPHKRSKRKKHKDLEGNPTAFPPEFPREEIILEPEGCGACEYCGKDKVKISEKVTEKLCEVPVQYSVKRIIRPVYGCQCGKGKLESSIWSPS